MESDYNYKPAKNNPQNQTYKWRLSIFALSKPILINLILAFSGYLAVPILYEIGYAIYIFAFLYFLYNLLYYATSYLYINDAGIWFKRGFLPWKKGIIGVVWHDAGEAGYRNSFFGWIIKSYPVIITNRYNNRLELNFPFIKNGHKAITFINSKIYEMRNKVN